jgi:hypothetical protein
VQLIVSQFTVATFLVFLVDEHGWHASAAGRMPAIAQVGGAATRLAAGSATSDADQYTSVTFSYS